MSPAETPPRARIPEPLPYQRATTAYLKSEEAEVWNWFASTRKRQEQAEAVRLDLLKSTYRVESADQPKLYGLAEDVLGQFGMRLPMTLYQAQTGGGLNAALAYVPGEAHIVFSGPVATVLSEAELKAVLGHELAHLLLYEGWDGEFLVASELLRALANDPQAAASHLESARLFGLYTEVFADRGACLVSGDAGVAISSLIKIETGLSEVSSESYLRQADEVFSKSRAQTNQLTHPESYIRARALKLWSDRGEEATAEIERMIEGPMALDRLDLLGQQKVARTTRRLLRLFSAPAWVQTETVLAHARLFFDDFVSGAEKVDDVLLVEEIQASATTLQDYFCYVLLDLVTVDRELGDAALAAALVLSRRLGLDRRFSDIALKELRLGKKVFAKIEREAETILAQTEKVGSNAS